MGMVKSEMSVCQTTSCDTNTPAIARGYAPRTRGAGRRDQHRPPSRKFVAMSSDSISELDPVT